MSRFDPRDYVKIEFKDELELIGEWMWVRVESSDDKERLVFDAAGNLYGTAFYGGSNNAGVVFEITSNRD